MSMQAICPSCGNRNTMGRMFCMSCGAPMTGARPEAKAEVSVGQRLTAGLARMIRLVLTLALLFVIALLLWPLTPTGMTGDLQDQQRMEQKLRELKGGVLDGASISRRISEVEVNAYLAALVTASQPELATSLSYQMKQVVLTLEPNQTVVMVRSALGPVELSYQLIGQPAADGRRFSFQVEQARLGHLALPGPARAWLASRVAVVFSQMLDERSLLDQLERLVPGQGEVEVANVGR